MNEDEIRRQLTDTAEEKFGLARADQLRQDIAKLALELADVRKQALTIEDEP